MIELSGRAAFITGGASGIGLAIGQALAAAGVRVTLADIDVDELERVLPTFEGEALTLPLDTRDRAGWSTAKAAAEARFGPLDILVNNAGVGPNGRALADMDPADFDRVLAINLMGVFNGVHAFAAEMRDRGVGHIVNTASMAGLTGGANLGAYVTAKFGVVGLSEVLRAELAPHGVGVSVLCPGLVRTRLLETSLAPGIDMDMAARSSLSLAAIEPAGVGQRVVEAIRRDELYVITHPEYRDAVASRSEGLLAAFDRAGA